MVELVPILAVARNGVIGRDGRLPWHLPPDLKRFKAITMGHPILMGRRTFAELGRPLPGRTSIVVTRDPAFRAEGVVVARSLDEAVAQAAARDRVAYVIGGADVYRQTFPLARRVHLTVLDRDVEGDTRLDPLDAAQWRAARVEEGEAPGEPPLRYAFVDLERVEPPAPPTPPEARSWTAFLPARSEPKRP